MLRYLLWLWLVPFGLLAEHCWGRAVSGTSDFWPFIAILTTLAFFTILIMPFVLP